MREALLRPQHDGLVVRRGYQGTAVSQTSFDEAVQMARIRLALETESARRAALAMAANDFEALDSIVDRISAAEASHHGYALSELDREFHLTIFRSASLTTLEPILTRCALHIHRFTFGHSQTNATPDSRVGLPSSADQNRELRDALATAAPDTAAAAMREHIEVILGHWSPTLLHAVRNADW